MYKWKKGVVTWQMKKVLYLSVPFTWLVNDALKIIRENPKLKPIVGGPAAVMMKDMFDGVAEVRESTDIFEPVVHHNPLAVFTTRGCSNKCSFCIVPKVEGAVREIRDFIPRPIICDNNFLAVSKKHIKYVINRIKKFPIVDFNQGLEARLFTNEIAEIFTNLKDVHIRFAFDSSGAEKYVVDAINLAFKKGFKRISCYLLFGYKDTPAEALYRMNVLIALKKKNKNKDVNIFAMRYQPLDTMIRDSYINEKKGWTIYEMMRFRNYASGVGRGGIFKNVSFDEYDSSKVMRTNKSTLIDLKEGREERWKQNK